MSDNHRFKIGDTVEISRNMEGTSIVTGTVLELGYNTYRSVKADGPWGNYTQKWIAIDMEQYSAYEDFVRLVSEVHVLSSQEYEDILAGQDAYYALVKS